MTEAGRASGRKEHPSNSMHKIHPVSRLLLAIAVLALIAGFFTPLWQIQLWAPQYPEGLNMKIWINNLSGAFDIINGLNHYIGMALIKVEMFPEFGFMIYVLGALVAFGLIAAIKGTRTWLWMYVIVLCCGALAGLIDFYAWGYQYGHNLNPNAAIQVPGMTYQPPIIGYKNLLNFTAYSGPDIGGWVMIVSGALCGLLLVWEQWFRKGSSTPKSSPAIASQAAVAALAATCALTSCDAKPEPMRYGLDECTGCKMTIADKRFGAEILTKKGRVIKFDDLGCMADYIKEGHIAEADIKQRVVCDFAHPTTFIPVEEALYLKNDALNSPMRSDSAAFSSQADLDQVKAQLGAGQQAKWPAVVCN